MKTDDWKECAPAWFFVLDKERSCEEPNRAKINEALQNLRRLGYSVKMPNDTLKLGSAERIPHTAPKRPVRSAVMLSKLFGTNEKYIIVAKRLKLTDPEKFKQVQTGELTIPQILRDEKIERQLKKQEADNAK